MDELYNARARLVCSAALPPDELFSGDDSEAPLLDLEALQFETAVEGECCLRGACGAGGCRAAGLVAVQVLGCAEPLCCPGFVSAITCKLCHHDCTVTHSSSKLC